MCTKCIECRRHDEGDEIKQDAQHTAVEIWGGMECTINRVHEEYFDQYAWSGHRTRLSEDVASIASLGIKTLRTALHWEYFEATQDWTFFDQTMEELKRKDIVPVVGLLHHGSGPRQTDLLDSDFPGKLAAYALQVAERYPSVVQYTPVNEPNTTSRFACLYGHWYPHHRSMESYIRALVNQIKATVLSMQAIRTVQPLAELVYTEDGGGIFSTPAMEAFRIAREHRRWLGTDLLCGLVTAGHPLFPLLLKSGFSADEILWFSENTCPPGVIGLNYYLTSDRFLDDRVELYPASFHGGDSGSDPLVDIEAVRVRPEGIRGIEAVLREAWDRYRIPVAITEVHLGGESDDQLRWLSEVYAQAQAAARSGVDVRAVTIWALFGSWNWTTLCTRDVSFYEAGVFALVHGSPEPTPLAEFVRHLAAGSPYAHPALMQTAWWNKPSRIVYAP